MAHWATAPLDRNQITLFAPTLDQTVADEHSVRLFAEMLEALDFSDWERMYVLAVGQPPIHPRVMAGCILYGLSLGIRSSRRLEDAAANRLDFIWLLQGRVPDHATICKFRTAFGPQLKGLFRQVCRVAIELGLIAINQIAIDGSAFQANNSRYATNRRATLEQKLAEADRQIEQLLKEAAEQDRAEDELFGEAAPGKIPASLRDVKARQDRLARALANLKKLEQEKKEKGVKEPPKGSAIPTTDPESRVLPAKQGGYAPAYAAVLANDTDHGFVLDVQVIAGNDEGTTVLPAVDSIEKNFGSKPDEVLADSNFNNGPNLAGLAERGIEPLMPPRQKTDASAAGREDPSQPVPEADRPRLPVNPRNNTLNRSGFLYNAEKDHYHCPMGRVLPRTKDKSYNHQGNKGVYRIYQSLDCAGCPLASQCLGGKSPTRRLCRDEHEPLREAMAERMNSEAGRAKYNQRAPTSETAFAAFKGRLNLRQLLLRGLEKVKIEFDWAATAVNLTKLINLTAR